MWAATNGEVGYDVFELAAIGSIGGHSRVDVSGSRVRLLQIKLGSPTLLYLLFIGTCRPESRNGISP